MPSPDEQRPETGPDSESSASLYSSYSDHFRELDPALYDQNRDRLDTPLEHLRTRLDLALIDRYVQGPDVLDFPIGTGRIYPHFLERFAVHGYDICAPYIEQARSLHPRQAGRFHVCSFEEPLRDRQFDSIFSFRVLDQVKELDLVMRNVGSLLKPGGRWLFTLYVPAAQQAALRARVEAAGLIVKACHAYDFHAGHRRLGPRAGRLAGYWRAAVARRWVPYALFALVDRLLSRHGSHFWVLERPKT